MLNLEPVRVVVLSLPVPVSERAFRLAARRLDVNHLTGRQMMILPSDVPKILKEIERCRTKEAAKRRAKRR